MTLLFDFTTFVTSPTASGIQRVLREIARRVDDDDRFSVVVDGAVYLLEPASAVELLDLPFSRAGLSSSALGLALRHSIGRISLDQIDEYCSAYVLSELTYDFALLESWGQLLELFPDRVGAIFYDALPELKRPLIGGQPPFGAGEYYRLVSRVDRVACISHAAREELATISHRSADDYSVVPLGADHFPRSAQEPGTHFVVLGDLRTKKRVIETLEAFRSVATADQRLVILGRAIPGCDAERDAVLEATQQDHRVSWEPNASDEDVVRTLASSRACIFVARDEGFGLPAVEAIQTGVPVIVDAELPSLRYLDPDGTVALDTVTIESIASAIEYVSGPEGLALREAARISEPPTWSGYVAGLRNVFTG